MVMLAKNFISFSLIENVNFAKNAWRLRWIWLQPSVDEAAHFIHFQELALVNITGFWNKNEYLDMRMSI